MATVLVSLIVSACGAGAAATTGAATAGLAATGGATSAPPTAASAPVSTAPASFQLAVKGDPNVTGTWGASFGINCNNPTLTGYDVLLFAQSPDTKAVVLITLNAGRIDVSERAGQGATYTDREFTGIGVTSLDPAHGGAFDSDLTIVPTPSSKPGTLGTITHVSGTVDCGNQTIGASTVVVTGSDAEGPINGPFARFRATCNHSAQYGNSAGLVGVLTAGSTATYFIVNFPASGTATIFSTSDSPPAQHSYTIAKSGTLTVSATGAHVDADYTEVVTAGATPHTIHLAGDTVCGTINNG
ncbi:MAG TPA: hypothetical protein VE011_09825 [Candidatus Dormibacteraeota bacterium]|nr:hypothetical protein [Candidatus Dormibacteraeota bacterium]